MLLRVSHPIFELRAQRDGSSGIVWKTEIDNVDVPRRRLGDELIFGEAWQIGDSFVTARAVNRSRVSGHHVGVYVDRIDRIGGRDLVVIAEHVEDVSAVRF